MHTVSFGTALRYYTSTRKSGRSADSGGNEKAGSFSAKNLRSLPCVVTEIRSLLRSQSPECFGDILLGLFLCHRFVLSIASMRNLSLIRNSWLLGYVSSIRSKNSMSWRYRSLTDFER